jgi:four helix bundle protein
MDEADLKARTKLFGLRCMKLPDSLPKTVSGRTTASQLIRSATSVGANYRSACRGRSKAEFISKLGIVEEEVDGSAYWLELIIESGMKPEKIVGPLHDEAVQLTRIIAASIRTARPVRSQIQNSQSKIQNF